MRIFELIEKSGETNWLSAAFITWKSSTTAMSLSDFMKTEYGVDCQCHQGEVERECLERCLRRHVALFYSDYVSSRYHRSNNNDNNNNNNTNHDTVKIMARPFAIPQCDYLGLQFEADGARLEGDLGGSQSRVFTRPIAYFDTHRQYLVKTFNDKEDKQKKPFEPRRGLNRLMMMSEDGDNNKRRNDRGAYYRETTAFRMLPSQSPFFIHPVCYWDNHKAILYPFYSAGDLIPDDHDDPIIQQMQPASFAKIARELMEAVHQMHMAGLAHMDLKPENVLIGGSGQADRAAYLTAPAGKPSRVTLKIIDFGLCIRNDDFKGLGCLKVGTKVTMSPEQLMCHRPMSPAADWWGVGATLYRLRVMWDPALGGPDVEDEEEREERRSELLGMRDHHWQHAVMPLVEEFGADWNQMIGELLQLYPEFRQFDKNMDRLWKLPFLQNNTTKL